jgi:hypothetical protein
MERVTAQSLAGAIQAALALPAPPREAVARRLRESDGRNAVVDRLEAILAGGRT